GAEKDRGPIEDADHRPPDLRQLAQTSSVQGGEYRLGVRLDARVLESGEKCQLHRKSLSRVSGVCRTWSGSAARQAYSRGWARRQFRCRTQVPGGRCCEGRGSGQVLFRAKRRTANAHLSRTTKTTLA